MRPKSVNESSDAENHISLTLSPLLFSFFSLLHS